MLIGLSSVYELGRTPFPFGRGNGRLLSGPASPDNTSYEDRRWILIDWLVLPVEGVCECERPEDGDGSLSRSSGDIGGELRMPGGRGRGPRRRLFSRLCS